MKVLEIALIRPRSLRMSFLIAMQKVVGSNPISRFFANALHVGRLVRRGSPNQIASSPHVASVVSGETRLRYAIWQM